MRPLTEEMFLSVNRHANYIRKNLAMLQFADDLAEIQSACDEIMARVEQIRENIQQSEEQIAADRLERFGRSA